jgi:hypothetical protein
VAVRDKVLSFGPGLISVITIAVSVLIAVGSGWRCR